MTAKRWPCYDARLTERGSVSVGADGALIIEIRDGFRQRDEDCPCGLAASDAVALAYEILKRGKATHRVVEREAIGDVYERLRDIIEDDE